MPPQAPELEQAVLGTVMLERDAYDIASGILKPASFYVEVHQKIWEACRNLVSIGHRIDMLLVADQLRKAGELEQVGGAHYLQLCTANVVSGAHLESHCRVVQEKFIERELIRIGGAMVHDGYEDALDAFEQLGQAEAQLYQLATGHLQHHYRSARAVAMDTMSDIEHVMANPGTITGVPTGYPALDRFTGGWQKANLIILAARPSVGKTALALNLARNAAACTWKPTGVGIFTLEMSAGELMKRMMSAESRVGLDSILHGKMTDWQFRELMEAQARIMRLNIQIDETAGIDMPTLRTKARRMVARDNVTMIIIDYLQLMKGEGFNRDDVLGGITRDLKALAKELDIPIIALSQLNREVEKRHGGEPQLSDLRESGSIEQDADIVAFLTRPDYQKKADEVDPMFRDQAWMKFKKHRNGQIDDLVFRMVKEIQSWFDPEEYNRYRGQQPWSGAYEAAAPPDNPRAGIIPPRHVPANIVDPSVPKREQLGEEDDIPF